MGAVFKSPMLTVVSDVGWFLVSSARTKTFSRSDSRCELTNSAASAGVLIKRPAYMVLPSLTRESLTLTKSTRLAGILVASIANKATLLLIIVTASIANRTHPIAILLIKLFFED